MTSSFKLVEAINFILHLWYALGLAFIVLLLYQINQK